MKDNIISRAAVLDEINKMPTMTDANGAKYIEKTCLKIRINMLRPMDVVPVRYGHWIKISNDWEYLCSECRHLSSCQTIYCSACGAQMYEKENSNEVD